MRKALTGVLALTVVLGVSACGNQAANSVAAQAQQGDEKGYVAGDGSVEQLPVSQRGKPVQLSGTLLNGKPWSIDQAKGKMVVINVWGAWCPPCQAEMPQLEKAWKSFQKHKQPVVMIGLDQRDSPDRALATLKKWKISYPSLRDDGGQALLALQNKVTATPTTLVLDAQHRIAGRVSGQVTADTLTGLVQDVQLMSSKHAG